MKIYADQRITPLLTATGVRLSPVYLFNGSVKSAVFDAGLTVIGPVYSSTISQELGDKSTADYLFITHSHWDHCGAMAYLKQSMPGMKICGHRDIPGILQKESVINQIRIFNDMMAEMYREQVSGGFHFENADFDILLSDGDSFDLGNAHCIAYETPGHTRDSISYYIPEQGILFPGEAIGVPEGKEGDGVQIEFLSSYDDYLASIQRLAELRPEIICMAHEWVFTGRDAADYLEKSYTETIRYRATIERYLDEANGDTEAAVELMAKKEYDERGTFYQPRFAYIANTKVQVKQIASMR